MAGEPEPDLTPEQMKNARKKFVDTSADHWRLVDPATGQATPIGDRKPTMTQDEIDAYIRDHGGKPTGHARR